MPLSRIEIEQLGPDRWVAEVEAGGTSARRQRVTGTSFDDIMSGVIDAHAALTAPPAAKDAMPAKTAREAEAVESDRIAADVDDIKAREASDDDAEPVSLDALREEAAALGIDVDGRWGERRLRHEIELARR